MSSPLGHRRRFFSRSLAVLTGSISRPVSSCRWRPSRLCLEQLEDRLAPAQLTVTSALDPAHLTAATLRYAINQANVDAAKGISDTIVFNTARMGSDTITLQHGELSLGGSGTVTIDGGSKVTISGSGSRVFEIAGQAVLKGLTISGGAGGGDYVNGIYTYGLLNDNDGGGIAVDNDGNLTLSGATLTGNYAVEDGGAIDNYGSLTVTNCTIANNRAGAGAGAIDNWGTLTMASSTLSANTAFIVGGLVNNTGTFFYTHGNSSGTTVYNGTVTLEDCIVAGNTAMAGTGSGSGGHVGPASPPDIGGSVQPTSSYNFIGWGAGIGISNGVNGNQIGTGIQPINSLLAPLGSYGGTIQTMALLSKSPALGAGTSIAGVNSDERGLPRPATPDIGAYQCQPVASFRVTAPATATVGVGFPVSVAALDRYGNSIPSYAGSVTLATSDGQVATPRTVPLTDGTGTATVSVQQPDAINLTAAAGSITGTSGRIAVDLKQPDFAISTPATVTAGTSFNITIRARSLNGQTNTSYDGSVTLTCSDGQKVSPAAVTLVKGTATVAVTLDTADTVTLTARAGTISGVSGSFEVNPVLIPVTTTSDAPGHTGTSLRDAIGQADADAKKGISPIEIQFNTTAMGDTDITLQQGALELTAGAGLTTIEGSGIAISGNNTYRIFQVDSGADVVLSGLTITYGNGHQSNGGGISNQGTLTVSDCTVQYSEAYEGGGIFNSGTLTVSGSTLDANSAVEGGGIGNTGELMVNDSSWIGGSPVGPSGLWRGANTASGNGGGIYNDGTATVDHSWVAGNFCPNDAGGIINTGTLYVQDGSVIEHNWGYDGAGIDNSGTVYVTTESWVETNIANARGGGIYNQGTAIINNSYVYKNFSGSNGGGVYNFSGGTVIVEGDSSFEDNNAETGAGIDNLASLTVTGSTFNANQASSDGGGIANYGTLNVLNGALIEYNQAYDGGGIYNSGRVNVTSGSWIEHNHASSEGGGIYNLSSGWVDIGNSTLDANQAYSNGGAISNYGGVSLEQNAVVEKNTATDGGGLYNVYLGTANINGDTSFAGNHAYNDGGAIYTYTGELVLVWWSHTGNSALIGPNVYYSGANYW
jgi:predicted outer membrane repeat protein